MTRIYASTRPSADTDGANAAMARPARSATLEGANQTKDSMMNDEQVAMLTATVEVLGGAIRYLLARDIKPLPESYREEFLATLQGALSKPLQTASSMSDSEAAAHAATAVWQPLAAERLIDGVRQQFAEARR